MSDTEVTALVTLQFTWGGLFDASPAGDLIHLVRSTARGTPGPTLCGVDRFAPGGPGWSVGGGVDGPGIILQPCPGCVSTARASFPGLPVSGIVGGRQLAAQLGVPFGGA
ncbi:MAG TPA: hypothetical protein VGM53_35495 [Streptosporangiaceae bacterium]|jgi:hypothetical protein